MKTIKLTETQINVLAPLINKKHESEANLQNALVLITGDPFKSYSLKDGILTVEEFTEEEKPGK